MTNLSHQSNPEQPEKHRRVFRLERRRVVRYRVSVAITATISWLFWIMPGFLRSKSSDLVGDLFFRLAPTYRLNAMDNIRHVLPEADEREVELVVRSICRESIYNFRDLLLIPHYERGAIVHPDPLIEGSWSYLDDALAGGKGAIIVTAHVGPFDYIMQLLHQRGYKMTSVTGRTTSRFVFDGITWLRRRHNANIVEATPSGIRRVFQALRQGECAAFLGDFDFFGTGMKVTFFGYPASIPQGPVRIARETGAPIVPLFARRVGNRQTLIMHQPFVVEKTRDMEADFKAALAKLVDSLERGIGGAPEQWVMFQKMWPLAPIAPSPPRPDTEQSTGHARSPQTPVSRSDIAIPALISPPRSEQSSD